MQAQTLSQLERELREERRRHKEVLDELGKWTAINYAPAGSRSGNGPSSSSAKPAAPELSSVVERSLIPTPATATTTTAEGNKLGAIAADQALALNPAVSETSNQCLTSAAGAPSPAPTLEKDDDQVQVSSLSSQEPEKRWSSSPGPVRDNKPSVLSVIRAARDRPSVMSVISAARVRAAAASADAHSPPSSDAAPANTTSGTAVGARQVQPLLDDLEKYLRAVTPTSALRAAQPAVYGEAQHPVGSQAQAVANQTSAVGNQAGQATAEQAQAATNQLVTCPPTVSMGIGNVGAAPELTQRAITVKSEPQEAPTAPLPNNNGVSSASLVSNLRAPPTTSCPSANSAGSVEPGAVGGDREQQQAATAAAQAAASPTVTACPNAVEPPANVLAASQHDGSMGCPSVAAFACASAAAAAAVAAAADDDQAPLAQRTSPRRLTKFVPVVGPVSAPTTAAVPTDGDETPARRTSPRLLTKFFPIAGPVSAPATAAMQRDGDQAPPTRDEDQTPPARRRSPRTLKPFVPVVGPVSAPSTAAAKVPSPAPATRNVGGQVQVPLSERQELKGSSLSPGGPVRADKPSAQSVPSATRRAGAKSTTSTAIAPRPPSHCAAAASQSLAPNDLITFLRKATPTALRAAQTAVYGEGQDAAGSSSSSSGQEQAVANQTPGVGGQARNQVAVRNARVEITQARNVANQQQGNKAAGVDEQRVARWAPGRTANRGEQLGMATEVQGATNRAQGVGQGAEAHLGRGASNGNSGTVNHVQQMGHQAPPQMTSNTQPLMVCPSVAMPWMPFYQRPVFQFVVVPIAPAQTTPPYSPSYSQVRVRVLLVCCCSDEEKTWGSCFVSWGAVCAVCFVFRQTTAKCTNTVPLKRNTTPRDSNAHNNALRCASTRGRLTPVRTRHFENQQQQQQRGSALSKNLRPLFSLKCVRSITRGVVLYRFRCVIVSVGVPLSRP